MRRRYSWRPDLPDGRDHLFGTMGTLTEPLPPRADLREHMTPVEDQQNLGSCTAQAIVGALEYLDKLDDGHFTNRSRLFLYYQERVLEGTTGEDSGAMIRDGVKAAKKVGVCRESVWPYKISKFREPPPPAAYTDAAVRKISEYQRVTSLTGLRAALAVGFPVVFGFSVYASFESDAVAKSGIVPLPKRSEEFLGGHAVLAVGYDDAKRWVICRNSWGRDWAQDGYFFLPYAYVIDRNLSDDYWMIKR